jgi:hypothetical protein
MYNGMIDTFFEGGYRSTVLSPPSLYCKNCEFIPVPVGFFVVSAALEQGFVQVLPLFRFSPVGVIPPMLRTRT